uniref:Mitochondrial import receptor subunit TOM9-2 n=1 Tax=Ananas comosus var. bracteatus TaxID=296719 RepID=A0A6V7Q2C5_ANACO|nr:unnamed protein product [Ananas comosus var. bracteatus]
MDPSALIRPSRRDPSLPDPAGVIHAQIRLKGGSEAGSGKAGARRRGSGQAGGILSPHPQNPTTPSKPYSSPRNPPRCWCARRSVQMSSSLSRRGRGEGEGEGVLGSISRSPIVVRGREAAAEAATVTKKLLRSTGKAAWIAGTTFLVLFVPLIIEMDREQQLNELELQQATLLGGPSPALPPPPPSK